MAFIKKKEIKPGCDCKDFKPMFLWNRNYCGFSTECADVEIGKYYVVYNSYGYPFCTGILKSTLKKNSGII